MSVVVAYIAVVLIWSTTPLAISWSAEELDLSFAIALRMFIGLTLSYAWLRWRGEKLSFDRGAIRLYAVSLLGTVLAMYAVYWSSRYVASGLISVLFGLAPILGGVYAAAIFAEKFLSPRSVCGALCALLGLVVIFQRELLIEGDGWKGVLGILLAVNLYTLNTVLIKRMSHAYSSLMVNTGSLMASMLVLFPVWLFFGGGIPTQFEARGIGAIIYLGVFGSFLGFVLFYYILKRLPAANAMLMTLMTPVIALYLGAALSNESIDRDAVIGSACVMLGLLIYLWPAMYAGMRQAYIRVSG